jgi:hypothetical protein
MSNEFVIKNGFHSRGNSEITGSLTVTGSINAPNIANTETAQLVYYNTSSGAFTYGSSITDQTKIFSWFMNVT